jgi:alkanesulfonate monooxygenase SsuD/methylene tetrahydromethanopterin reductase-like flavin-dependent oxidoreductase (luciferase family)
MLRLTAQHADIWNGWVVFGRSHPDVVPAMREQIDTTCRLQGRDPATLARSLTVQIALLGEHFPASDPLTGSPEELAASLRALATEGIDRVQVFLVPTTPATVERFGVVLDLLDRG